MKKVTFLAFTLFVIQSAFGQVSSTLITLQWSDSLKEFEFSDYRTRKMPFFEGASFDESLFGFWPVYFSSIQLNEAGKPILQITDESYASLNFSGKISLAADNFIGTSIKFNVDVGYERMKPVADISILPIRKNPVTGELEKLISFRYHLQVVPSVNNLSSYSRDADDYATQSVLGSGRWFKIAVSQDGIYKLDKGFLESLGINTSQIDPRNIRVYGNGGGMVPEDNGAYRNDDLYENAIEVIGEADGSFDANDYVLFYGQGPHRWNFDSTNQRFYHLLHNYSNYTYYFLNTDQGSGKRVQLQSTSSQTPNVTISQFNDYAFHESEEENMIESGREWYGESFEFETFHSFPFSFQNVVCNSQVGVKAAMMSRSIYSSNSFTLSANNQNIGSASIGAVCSDYTCPFGIDQSISAQFTTCDNSFDLDLNYIKGAADAQGFLNYIELNLLRELKWPGSQTNFRSVASWGAGNIAEFKISNSDNTLRVWDVTNLLTPVNQQMNLNGTDLNFVLATDTLHEFVLFDTGEGKTPIAVGEIANQNLHSIFQSDFVIVTPATFLAQAEELAQLHRDQDGISVNVVLIDELYNEFSSGATDICAIRDFMRMLYVRSEGDSSVMPKYLLLFGDGSYDNKGNIEGYRSLIPTYQSYSSLSTTGSFVSDDFYGMLDTNEGGNMLDTNYKLDIGIGRLPVNNTQQANDVLNKIKIYTSSKSFGNWRNVITFAADDEDSNIHLNDCDDIAQMTAAAYPEYNIDKIYLDAYQEISIPGGARYPDVNNAIQNRLYNGTLILNYVGHGGVAGLAHERIFTVQEIENLNNLCKLACFVTATCEFSKYDDPAIESAGEKLLLNQLGGAIAMVTTVRLVYSSANYQMNKRFMEQVLLPVNGVIPPIGETFRKGKNNTTGDTNNRKFTLLADPALRLDIPEFNIETASINGIPVSSISDTISALEKVTITGTLEDWNGNILNTFNGFVYPTVYDKAVVYQTLANDPSSYVDNFIAQKNIIYNGKASVVNGTFSFSFIVPKDIQYQFGFGKLSYYAENGSIDAHGYKNDLIIGGVADTFDMDANGPVIQLYMNDENFANGGITDEDPLVLVKLSDESGVNTVGTGIGHDVTGVLDNNSQNTYVMNNNYTADLDSYQSGEVRYPLNNLDEGMHSFNVKAWDVFNNSSQEKIDFIVAGSAEMALEHVLNYPNPFTTRTEFMFEHNMPGQSLDILIRIYSVSGKLVKSIHQSVTPESGDELCSAATVSGGYHIRGIFWDGKDDYGDPIGKGVYVYQVNVNADNGLHADQFEKLVILN